MIKCDKGELTVNGKKARSRSGRRCDTCIFISEWDANCLLENVSRYVSRWYDRQSF